MNVNGRPRPPLPLRTLGEAHPDGLLLALVGVVLVRPVSLMEFEGHQLPLKGLE